MGEKIKSIVAFIGATAETAILYLDDNSISGHEWTLFGAGVMTLIGVYFLPNMVGKENVNNLAHEAIRRRRRPTIQPIIDLDN